MRYPAFALLVVLTRTLAGQSARSPDLSVGINTWRLDASTASAAATWVTPLSISGGLRVSEHVAAFVQYDVAGERGRKPGLRLPGAGIRIDSDRRAPASAFASVGYHHGIYDADAHERLIANCTAQVGCLYEGETHRSGGIRIAAFSLGGRISIVPPLSLELLARVNRRTGGEGGRADGGGNFGGVGAALAWRP